MENILKIVEFSAPKQVQFSFKRKVLIEKYFSSTTAQEHYKHARKTLLLPGENLYFVDIANLHVHKFTIAHLRNFPQNDGLNTDSKLYLFAGEKDKLISIDVVKLMNSLDNCNPVHYATSIGGEKLICSSEKSVLESLQQYIPLLVKNMHHNLGHNNTSEFKRYKKMEKVKKVQKLHKKIVNFLKKNP